MSDDYRRDRREREPVRGSAGVATRGGPEHPLTFIEAQALFAMWKAEEFGWLKARIVWLAGKNGEVHGDDLAGLELSSRNLIGATFGGLVANGLLEAKNKQGVAEHRKSQSEAAHGRRSYVYRLTRRGSTAYNALVETPKDKLPHRPKTAKDVQPALFEDEPVKERPGLLDPE